ncbi:30S ribosome-binding factor RbfA [Oceanospirillum beijerinckii]|uniref:30S ribosome-binding factor RbfA n=1 Tax=Oceanospirillum beijerinckii TaxID=64976 RepID=UPI000409C53D|nr:30S ribosome-binding factor RbfA [Oceanospirillum beijerinckii]MAC46201.1 30S ribosome-binding factor RbfA [Oceanospirillum sp.]
MSREFKRTDRIGEQLQKELAQLIQFQVKDPRLGMVTVNHVKISPDLGHADVYVTILGKDTEEEAKEDLKVLNSATGFLRREIGKAIKLRVLPHLRFRYDVALVQGQKLSSLIDKAVAEDNARSGSDAADNQQEG